MTFSRALNASFESIWTSSMMYILYLHRSGVYSVASLSSRASFTEPLEAASISMISARAKLSASRQISH